MKRPIVSCERLRGYTGEDVCDCPQGGFDGGDLSGVFEDVGIVFLEEVHLVCRVALLALERRWPCQGTARLGGFACGDYGFQVGPDGPDKHAARSMRAINRASHRQIPLLFRHGTIQSI